MRWKIFWVLVIAPSVFLSVVLFFLIEAVKEETRASAAVARESVLTSVSGAVHDLFQGASNRSDSFRVKFTNAAPIVSGAWPSEIKISDLQKAVTKVCTPERWIGRWVPRSAFVLICDRANASVTGFPAKALTALVKQDRLTKLRLLTSDGMVLASTNESEDGQVFDRDSRRAEDFSTSKIDGLPLVLTIETAAFAGSSSLVMKSVIALIATFLFLFLIARIFSKQLTRNLDSLRAAISQLAKGERTSVPNLTLNDEFSSLASAFEERREVSVLVEKPNLDVVPRWQKTFLPKAPLLNPHVDALIFNQPSEPSAGDWCYFFERSGRVIFCIADPAGRGVDAALLSAAARLVQSQMEHRFISPKIFMAELNSAVWSLGGGALEMSCLIAEYNPAAETLAVCNASFELPYLYPLREGLSQRDFQLLSAAPGPRLGRRAFADYSERVYSVRGPVGLLIYSDGLVRLKNPRGFELGDRRLLSILSRLAGGQAGALPAALSQLLQHVSVFQGHAPLADDVSFILANLR